MSKVIGIIGGSGLYQIENLESVEEIDLDTPFGKPSDIIISAKLGSSQLLFLPRHSRKHSILPTEVNYRANIFALKELGATWCLSITAVGSLVEKFKPGEFVVPDQIIDRTKLRSNTFFGEGVVAHIAFANPYSEILRNTLIDCFTDTALSTEVVHAGATFVCMEGPAFSTRAESKLHKSWGADLIGMTVMPEAKLAREAELAYASLAMVTDFDSWKEEESEVDVSAVVETLKRTSNASKKVIPVLADKLKNLEPESAVSNALDTALMTKVEDIPEKAKSKLAPILKRYLG